MTNLIYTWNIQQKQVKIDAMAVKPILPVYLKFLKDIPEVSCLWLNSPRFFHLPGQAAAISYFDPKSQQHLVRFRSILARPAVKKWMDDPTLAKWEYQEMADSRSPTSFLFAVHETRGKNPQANSSILGFVYLYGERSETFRVKRLAKLGLLAHLTDSVKYLEVSFAIKPYHPQASPGSGLMSSSLRLACLQARQYIKTNFSQNLSLLAYIDPQNLPAHRTVIAAGFTKIGLAKYDPDSPTPSTVYRLNWRKLQDKIRQKLVELQPNT